MARQKTLEELRLAREKAEQDLKKRQDNLKQMKQKEAELTRRARTHRLCTHGAMLEQFLSPDEFSDDQIASILRMIFNDPGIIEYLNEIRLQTNSQTEIP